MLGETPEPRRPAHASAPPGRRGASRPPALLGERFVWRTRSAQAPRLRRTGPDVAGRPPRSLGSHSRLGRRQARSSSSRGRPQWLLGLWSSAADRRGRRDTRRRGRNRQVAGRRGPARTPRGGVQPLRFQCSPHYVNRALHPVIAHLELAAGSAPKIRHRPSSRSSGTWLRAETERAKDASVPRGVALDPRGTAPRSRRSPPSGRSRTLSISCSAYGRRRRPPDRCSSSSRICTGPTPRPGNSCRRSSSASTDGRPRHLHVPLAVRRPVAAAAGGAPRAAAVAARAGAPPRQAGRRGRKDARRVIEQVVLRAEAFRCSSKS